MPLALAPSLSADPADRIIVALDGMAPEQALAFAAQVDGLRWVKVGLELFVQAGPEVVAQLREQGLRVFLDLKFHDIPATMAGACRRAAALGAELITVHACAGSEALKAAQAAAVEGAQGAGQPAPTLAGGDGAHQLGGAAIATGTRHCPGHRRTGAGVGAAVGDFRHRRLCVCSPLEAAALRAQHPEPFALVTPGIRPKGAAVGDQARVMGPAEAIVIGFRGSSIRRFGTCMSCSWRVLA